MPVRNSSTPQHLLGSKGLRVPTFCLAALALLSVCAKGAVTNYKSLSSGYTLSYPADWHPQVVAGIFYIENFPGSLAVRAVRLPKGGAGIKLLTLKQAVHSSSIEPKDVEEFATMNSARDTVISRRHTEISNSSRTMSIVEVVSVCCAVSPYQESVDWYFRVADNMFVASLVYWQADPNSRRLLETLRTLVLSVEAVDRGKN